MNRSPLSDVKFRTKLVSFLVLATVISALFAQRASGAGVTIVTHGFKSSSIDHDHGWIEAMGNYVADRAGGTHYIYKLVVTSGSFTELVATLTPENSGLPPIEQSKNAEIVIKLYWDQVAGAWPLGDVPADTTSIGRIAYRSLTNLNHACELPIQIIGHSRGASVASEMAWFLGQQGIWVHQLTTLDPHPVSGIDAAVQIWDTVLFADNYYESYPYTFPAGANINGALNENLTGRLPGGYGDDLGPLYSYNNHSDVHLWYHGTVNTSSGASDGEQTFTGTMRNTWYTSDEWGGARAGFNFSRLGDGAYALDGFLNGYNDGGHNWFPDSRVNVTRSVSEWPTLTTLINNASGSVQAGNAFPVEFVYQSYDSGASVAFYLDTDQNPYNGNEIALTLPAINPQPSTGSTTKVTDVNATVPLSTPAGYYYIYDKITNPNGNRYLYARTQVRVLAAGTSAAPTITSVSPSTLPPSASTQLINIYGSNFKASGDPNASTFIFRDPANIAYVRTPIFVSSSQLQYNITVQSAVGTWSVTVTNAGQAASNLKTFLVQTPPPNTGSLTINLAPSDAVSAGAQWRVDGGSYRSDGDTATGLTPGSHTVSFKSVSGYTTPADKSVSVSGGANTTDSGSYVITSSGCSYSLSSSGNLCAAAGGSDGFNIIAPSGCAWAATVNVNWVSVTFGSSGVGTHAVNYSVDPNPSVSPRTGAITVGGQTFTINQNGNQAVCTFSLNQPGANWPASGGSNSFSLFTQGICDWEATKNVNWISIVDGNSGTGNGLIQYTVQSNLTSLSRSGVITVAGQTFSIVQNGSEPPPGTLMTGLQSPQGGIYLDGDFIYLGEGSGAVTRVSKTTGTIQPLGTVKGGVKSMALGGDFIYIGTGSGEIDVMPKTGGISSAIVTGDTPERVFYYNGRIYFTRFSAGQVASVSTGGGEVTIEGSGTPNAAGLLVDATGIYWAEFEMPNQIFSKVGTAQSALIGANLGDAQSRGIGLLVRSNILYYCGQGGVYAVPTTGGVPVRLGEYFGSGSALACDGTNLYAVSDRRGGTIIQIALEDSTVTTLATNILVATSVLEDQDKVYFTTSGASGNQGTLQWVEKVTPSMDSIAPTVSIGSPIAGAQFNDPSLFISGIASDDKGVAVVELRLNGRSWQTASGTTNWNFSVSLVAGNNTIEARSGDNAGNYSSLASVTVTYTPSDTRIPQAITFGVLSKQVVGDAPFALLASASSGLPVSFSVLSGPAMVSGNILTMTGAGLVVVRASQAGDATNAPAPNVDQVLLIVPGNNVITDAQRLANGMFLLRFYGETGSNYVVKTSTNLVHWLAVATNQISGLGYLEFMDASSTNFDRRFYQISR